MVRQACYPIETESGVGFNVVVDDDEQDELTAAIRDGTLAFPRGFQLLLDLIPPGSKVLDLGAHIGLFSLFAAASGYQVAAVEASVLNAQLLQESVAKNELSSLQVLNFAISDDGVESVDFIQGGPHGLVSNPYYDAPTISVPATTVDGLLRQIEWERVDFIKMDIEGSEVKALRGMPDYLARADAPAIFYESNGHTLYLFDETPNSLMALLEEFGYRCYLVRAGTLTPVHAGDLQAECNVDYLALKQPLSALNGWQVTPPLSREDIRQGLLSSCVHPHEHIRAHGGRTLAQAGPSLLQDSQIRLALLRLQSDPSEWVRNSVAWFEEDSLPTQALIWAHVQRVFNKLRKLIRGK